MPGRAEPVSEQLPVKVSGKSMKRMFASVQERLGTAYRWGGTSIDGFDCSGFVKYLYEDSFQLVMPRISSDMATLGKVVPRKKLKPGDLVFFSNSGRKIDHVGIYMGDGRFAHASSGTGVRIDRLGMGYYDKHYACGARIVTTD